MSELFYPDSIFWLILCTAAAGLLGFYVVGWVLDRRMRRLFPERAQIITVWADHEVIYDHPARGRSARQMSSIMLDLLKPVGFLKDLVFPRRRRGPPLFFKDKHPESIEFVVGDHRREIPPMQTDQERLALKLNPHFPYEGNPEGTI